MAMWLIFTKLGIMAVLVSGGVAATIYYGEIHTVPCTHRRHLIMFSPETERGFGENMFEKQKKELGPWILGPEHPHSVRVRPVADQIIGAVSRGLAGRDERLAAESLNEGKKKRRSKQPQTNHLDGLDWEVLVVRDRTVNAFCFPGGKIVVYTGLLDHFETDDEIATVLGHEVGHVVARHWASMITKLVWITIMKILVILFDDDEDSQKTSLDTFDLLLTLPFSRSHEREADHIGILLLAAAGFDPRIAPTVYEKLGKIKGDSKSPDYLSTHPSSKRRSELLSKAEVMDSALKVYKDANDGDAPGVSYIFQGRTRRRFPLSLLPDTW